MKSYKRRITKDDIVEVKLYLPRTAVSQLSMALFNMYGDTHSVEEWITVLIDYHGELHHRVFGSYRRHGQFVHDPWAGTTID